MSQPGLNRGLILDLLDKLRNPGKGTPIGEIEDEEPEVRGPGFQKPWSLLALLRLCALPGAFLLPLVEAKRAGGWGTWHRGYETAKGSRLGPRDGGAAGGHGLM